MGKDFSTVSGDILDFLKSISGVSTCMKLDILGACPSLYEVYIYFCLCSRFEVMCVLICL